MPSSGCHHRGAITCWRCVPRPSMPSSITSPGCRKTRRLEAESDAWGSAGVDQIAGLQDHELAEVVHDEVGVEHHRRGRPGLPALTVDVEEHRQCQHVLDLVLRSQPRPGRIEGLGRLALGPLTGSLQLEGPFADVVDQGEAGNRITGARPGRRDSWRACRSRSRVRPPNRSWSIRGGFARHRSARPECSAIS